MMLSVVQRSLLEKVAQDNGFDVVGESTEAWLAFTSTQAPLKLWLGAVGDGWCVVLSHPGVAEDLTASSSPAAVSLPAGAAAVLEVADLSGFHRVVRRAYQMSATLPDELLHEVERQTRELPRATEVECLVVQRVGQDVFRDGLMRYWEGRCAVTGCREPKLFNGLLLAVHLDAAFDRGFITFDDARTMLISPRLLPEDAARLGLKADLRVQRLESAHRQALAWHRAEWFR